MIRLKTILNPPKSVLKESANISIGSTMVGFHISAANRTQNTLQFIVASSKDLDAIKVSKSVIEKTLEDYCHRKTGLKWSADSNATAAGYTLRLDFDSIIDKLT